MSGAERQFVGPPFSPEPHFTLGEEIAHSVSHGAGLVAALAAGPFLIMRAVGHGNRYAVVGASVFWAAIVSLYLASTLYHSLPRGPAKRIFRIVEHGAIFLLIAGTYTPLTLVSLRGFWGWTLFGLVWALAIIGIALKALRTTRYRWLPGLLILGLGWLIVVAIRPLWLSVPHIGLLWLLAGGVAYTVGMAFFAATRVPYSHFVWHLFVLVGTACHFVAIGGYVI